MLNLKLMLVGASLLAALVAFVAGDYLGKKGCNDAIDAAVLAAQTDFELQLQQANSKSQRVVIKTIKQNEIIKGAVVSYDSNERDSLLAKIQNFEARK